MKVASHFILFLAAMLVICCSTTVYAQDNIARIYAELPNGKARQGTGFFVSKSGYIATAYHVIRDADRLTVFSNGTRTSDVHIVGFDAAHDLALLKSNTPEYQQATYFEISEIADPPRNSQIYSYGHPRGIKSNISVAGKVASDGFANSIEIQDHGNIFAKNIKVLLIDLTVYSGLSGAPVIHNGKVVGVISGSINEGGGLAWAIPSSHLSQLILSDPSLVRAPSAVNNWPKLDIMRGYHRSLTEVYGVDKNAARIYDNFEIEVSRLNDFYKNLTNESEQLRLFSAELNQRFLRLQNQPKVNISDFFKLTEDLRSLNDRASNFGIKTITKRSEIEDALEAALNQLQKATLENTKSMSGEQMQHIVRPLQSLRNNPNQAANKIEFAMQNILKTINKSIEFEQHLPHLNEINNEVSYQNEIRTLLTRGEKTSWYYLDAFQGLTSSILLHEEAEYIRQLRALQNVSDQIIYHNN